MIINKQKRIEFRGGLADVLFDREDLRKAIMWYSDKPVARVKKVFKSGRYWAVAIYDKKIHIHRLLMMYWLKRDLETDEYVHHRNGNINNNNKDNLEVMWASEHQRLSNKGRKFTEEHKRKIGEANKRRKGMKYRKKKVYKNPELLNSK